MGSLGDQLQCWGVGTTGDQLDEDCRQSGESFIRKLTSSDPRYESNKLCALVGFKDTYQWTRRDIQNAINCV